MLPKFRYCHSTYSDKEYNPEIHATLDDMILWINQVNTKVIVFAWNLAPLTTHISW